MPCRTARPIVASRVGRQMADNRRGLELMFHSLKVLCDAALVLPTAAARRPASSRSEYALVYADCMPTSIPNEEIRIV